MIVCPNSDIPIKMNAIIVVNRARRDRKALVLLAGLFDDDLERAQFDVVVTRLIKGTQGGVEVTQ